MRNNLKVFMVMVMFICMIFINGCSENIIKEESITKEVIVEEEPKEEIIKEEINFEGKLCKTNIECGYDLDGGDICIANSLYHITYKPRCDSKDAMFNAGTYIITKVLGYSEEGYITDSEGQGIPHSDEGIDPTTNFTLVCKYKKIMRKVGNC